MQRYFIKSDQLRDDQAMITGDDVHHIANVMRMSVGDPIIICCDRKSYLTEVVEINKAGVRVRIVETKAEDVELPVLVTIAQGMMKGDKFDLVIQKVTECGASNIIPIAMKRSVAKLDEKKAARKIDRWQRIAMEAARQSHRQVVPVVKNVLDTKGLVQLAAEFDVCLFAYEAHDEAARHKLADVVQKLARGMRVLVLIGPEGGIDETEVALLTKAGFRAVGLGPRILRTETAPIYVMSVLSYGLEIERRI